MPTLVKLGRVQIRLFAGHHLPPHFHLWTPDTEALVLISDFSVHRGTARRRDLEIALAWAWSNRAAPETEWERLNG
jgi:hypothetical protein